MTPKLLGRLVPTLGSADIEARFRYHGIWYPHPAELQLDCHHGVDSKSAKIPGSEQCAPL